MAYVRGDARERETYEITSLLDLDSVWPSEETATGEEMKIKVKEFAAIFVPLQPSMWISGTDIEDQIIENFKTPEFLDGCSTEDAKKSWSFFIHTISSAARILSGDDKASHGEDEDNCHLCIEMVLKDNVVDDDEADADARGRDTIEPGWDDDDSEDDRQSIGSPANNDGGHVNAQSPFDDPKYKDRCKLKLSKALLKEDNVIGMRLWMLSNHPNILTTSMRSQIESNKEVKTKRTPSKSSTVMTGPGKTVITALGLRQAHDGATRLSHENKMCSRWGNRYTVDKIWTLKKAFLAQSGYNAENLKTDMKKYVERDASGQQYFKLPRHSRAYLVPNVAEWSDQTLLVAHPPHAWLQLEALRGNNPVEILRAAKRVASEAYNDTDDSEQLYNDAGMNRRMTAKKQKISNAKDKMWDNQNSIHEWCCSEFTKHLKPERKTLHSSVQEWANFTTVIANGGNLSVSDVTIRVNEFRETMKMPIMAKTVIVDKDLSVFANVYKHFLKFADFFWQMRLHHPLVFRCMLQIFDSFNCRWDRLMDCIILLGPMGVGKGFVQGRSAELTFEECSKQEGGGTLKGLMRSGKTDRVNFVDEEREYLKTENSKSAKAIEDVELLKGVTQCMSLNSYRASGSFKGSETISQLCQWRLLWATNGTKHSIEPNLRDRMSFYYVSGTGRQSRANTTIAGQSAKVLRQIPVIDKFRVQFRDMWKLITVCVYDCQKMLSRGVLKLETPVFYRAIVALTEHFSQCDSVCSFAEVSQGTRFWKKVELVLESTVLLNSVLTVLFVTSKKYPELADGLTKDAYTLNDGAVARRFFQHVQLHLHDNVELVSWSIEQLETELIDPLTEPLRLRMIQLFSDSKFANDSPDGRLREGCYPDVQWRQLKDKFPLRGEYRNACIAELAELLHRQTRPDGDEENPSPQLISNIIHYFKKTDVWLPEFEQKNKESWDPNSKIEYGRKRKQTVVAHFQRDDENDENASFETKKGPIIKWDNTLGWLLNTGATFVNFGVHQLNISKVLEFGCKQDHKVIGSRLKRTGPDAYEVPEVHTFRRNNHVVKASQQVMSSSMEQSLVELATLTGDEDCMKEAIENRIKTNQKTLWSSSLFEYEREWMQENHRRLADSVGLEEVDETDWNVDKLKDAMFTR